MGIVGGNIMLLRERHVQPLSGQEEKLDHLDVRRQFTGMQRAGIGEVRIAAEQPVDHGADKAPFQQACRLWLFQRQRGKKRQVDRAVGGRAGIKRIDNVIGLAEPERQSDNEVGPDIADNVLRDRIWVGEEFGHQMRTRARLDSQPPWNRPPATKSYSAFISAIRL